MLHVQCSQGNDQKGALNMAGPSKNERKDGANWDKAARIATGFVVGTLLVWAWQEQGESATAILAVAVGIALGVIAFSLSRR